jgi:Eukaryotic glutathione synthase
MYMVFPILNSNFFLFWEKVTFVIHFVCLSASIFFLCVYAFRDGHSVAVVYFRAGYTPNDYPSEKVTK